MSDSFLFESEWVEDNGFNYERFNLRQSVVLDLIKHPLEGVDEFELAATLVETIQVELIAYLRSSLQRISGQVEMQLLFRSVTSVCARLRVPFPSLGFMDFRSLNVYFRDNHPSADTQEKIHLVEALFAPVSADIYAAAVKSDFVDLMHPVTPHSGTGWRDIDREIEEMKTSFRVARTAQAHTGIGNTCVRIIQLLCDVTFDPDRHKADPAKRYNRSDTKDRLEAVIEIELPGPSNAALRKYCRSLVELSQDTKHATTPNRQQAGMSADGVIALANMLRRIVPVDRH